jgi:hypothetical protein
MFEACLFKECYQHFYQLIILLHNKIPKGQDSKFMNGPLLVICDKHLSSIDLLISNPKKWHVTWCLPFFLPYFKVMWNFVGKGGVQVAVFFQWIQSVITKRIAVFKLQFQEITTEQLKFCVCIDLKTEFFFILSFLCIWLTNFSSLWFGSVCWSFCLVSGGI